MRAEQGLFGRWIIVRDGAPYLAWSGSRWVLHAHGAPTAGVQISNYETRDEAERAMRCIERRIYDLACTIGSHWRDQEGISGALLDELAELVP
jgi:hypothetical protein